MDKVLKDVKAVTEPVKVKKPPLSEVRNLTSDITFIMERKPVLKEEESSVSCVIHFYFMNNDWIPNLF